MKRNLEQRIETMDVKDKIFDVIVPTEEESEIKDGQRRPVGSGVGSRRLAEAAQEGVCAPHAAARMGGLNFPRASGVHEMGLRALVQIFVMDQHGRAQFAGCAVAESPFAPVAVIGGHVAVDVQPAIGR